MKATCDNVIKLKELFDNGAYFESRKENHGTVISETFLNRFSYGFSGHTFMG